MDNIGKFKKIRLMIIGFSVLVILIVGVTYAFFNYTRTGMNNTLSTSTVVFTSTDDTLLNIASDFPQDADLSNEDLVAMKTNHSGVLSVSGHNTLENGVKYSIYVIHGDDITGKQRLDDSSIKFQIEPDFTSGSNGISVLTNNYSEPTNLVFDNEGKALISTGLVKNTTELTTVDYNFYMWLDASSMHVSSTMKRETLAEGNPSLADTTSGNAISSRYLKNDGVLVSDVTLYPATSNEAGKIVYTTNEFSNGYYNIKFLVVAEEMKLGAYGKLVKNADTTTLIDFSQNSSDSNGKGMYLLPGTGNDPYPIYYYRGSINNNNVVFGGYCWQMVRTTDTGGIKMIYNGEAFIDSSGENPTYDCGATRPFQHNITRTTSLSQSTGYYYADDYEIVSGSGSSITYRLKSNINPITQVGIADATEAATKTPTIIDNYPYTCKATTDTATCTTLYKVDSYVSGTTVNVYASSDISIIGKGVFNSQDNSISDMGYMSNTRYTSASGVTSGAIYGKNIEWDGSNYLVIEDTEHTASTNTTKDNYHHYSCGINGTSTCSSVRYYYNNNYYIILANGELIEDVLYKMTGNGDETVKTRNVGYVLNQNNSTIKTTIENWFATNLTNVIDNTKTDYRQYIEDTIYCNDRNYEISGSNYSYTQSGWNPNGGDLTKRLYYSSGNRAWNNWYSTTNVPRTVCPNETDRFSVSSSIAHLNYPVGLLTADELVLAGTNGTTSSNAYYLNVYSTYWTMSPFLNESFSTVAYNTSNGFFTSSTASTIYGVRPVISLKLGVEFEKGGDGTPTNPYVVKYN